MGVSEGRAAHRRSGLGRGGQKFFAATGNMYIYLARKMRQKPLGIFFSVKKFDFFSANFDKILEKT